MVPGSGSKDGAKGDMILDGYLIESKSTVKDSLGIKLEWLRKIRTEALGRNKVPALALVFTDGKGRIRYGDHAWVAVPAYEFGAMLEELRDPW